MDTDSPWGRGAVRLPVTGWLTDDRKNILVRWPDGSSLDLIAAPTAERHGVDLPAHGPWPFPLYINRVPVNPGAKHGGLCRVVSWPDGTPYAEATRRVLTRHGVPSLRTLAARELATEAVIRFRRGESTANIAAALSVSTTSVRNRLAAAVPDEWATHAAARTHSPGGRTPPVSLADAEQTVAAFMAANVGLSSVAYETWRSDNDHGRRYPAAATLISVTGAVGWADLIYGHPARTNPETEAP